MLTETKDINWQVTLAEIAKDKGQDSLSAYILLFKEVVAPVYEILSKEPAAEITHDYSKLNPRMFNITKMPEATCDGCQ